MKKDGNKKNENEVKIDVFEQEKSNIEDEKLNKITPYSF